MYCTIQKREVQQPVLLCRCWCAAAICSRCCDCAGVVACLLLLCPCHAINLHSSGKRLFFVHRAASAPLHQLLFLLLSVRHPPGPRQHSVLVASRLSWSKLVAQIYRRSVLLATVRRTRSAAASDTSLPVLSDPLEGLCAASASRCRPLSRRRRIVTAIWPRMYHVLRL